MNECPSPGETAQQPEDKVSKKTQANDLHHWWTHVWIIALVTPLYLVFIPQTRAWVGLGFAELKQAPSWYVFVLGTCMAWCFGHSSYVMWRSLRDK